MTTKSTSDLMLEPLLKLRQAQHHTDRLKGLIGDYLATEPMMMTIVRDPNHGDATLYFEAQPNVPGELSLAIGDAIHNLRSALDHIVWKLIGAKSTKPRSVQFPVYEGTLTIEQCRDKVLKSEIALAGAEVVEAIAAMRPFPGGDKFIWPIHRLDIADKHRLILAVGQHASVSSEFVSALVLQTGGTVHVSALPAPPPAPGDHVERVCLQPEFGICFGEGEALCGEHVIETLDAARLHFQQLIETVAIAGLCTA